MAKKKSLDIVDWIAFILVIIGGLNWGLVGLFNYNLVYALFSTGIIEKIIYSLVGLAAIYQIFYISKMK
jgi:hypothetical protein